MNKAILGVVVVLGVSCGHPRPVGIARPPAIDRAESIVWVGIDYTQVKMVGLDAFRKPASIFPGMLKAWNALFVGEMIPELQNRLGKPVVTDITGMLERNNAAGASQIIEDAVGPEQNVTPESVARLVRGYELKQKSGVGLVFVMDTMVKLQEEGCLYVAFFEIETRAIVDSRRVCHQAFGIGFRNYWFNPIKAAAREL